MVVYRPKLAVIATYASNLSNAHVTRDSIGAPTWGISVLRAIK